MNVNNAYFSPFGNHLLNDPLDNPNSLAEAAEQARTAGRIDWALTLVNDALSIDPKNALALSVRASIYQGQGKAQEEPCDVSDSPVDEPVSTVFAIDDGDHELGGTLNQISVQQLHANPFFLEVPQWVDSVTDTETSEASSSSTSTTTETLEPEERTVVLLQPSDLPSISRRFFAQNYLAEPKRIAGGETTTEALDSNRYAFNPIEACCGPGQGIQTEDLGELEYHSLEPLSQSRFIDRLSFVMLERGLDGQVPQDSSDRNSRVVLVLAADQGALVQRFVRQGQDVLVVKSVNGDKNLAAYVTSRRLAAIRFARHVGARDLMMLDDNITRVHVSDQVVDGAPQWPALYRLFRLGAEESGLTLISSQDLGVDQRQPPQASRLQIDPGTFGSKMTYLNLQNITPGNGNWNGDHELFPHNVQCCLEEYFLHQSLRKGGLRTGAFSRDSLVICHSTKGSGICSRSTLPADYYIQEDAPESSSWVYRQAWAAIRSHVERDKKVHQKVHKALLESDPFKVAQVSYQEEESWEPPADGATLHLQRERETTRQERTSSSRELGPPSGAVASSSLSSSVQPQPWQIAVAVTLEGLLEEYRDSLRAPQQDAISACCQSLRNREESSHISLPMGIGKTRIAATLLFAHHRSPDAQGRVLVISPRLDLSSQLTRELVGSQEIFGGDPLNILQVDSHHFNHRFYANNKVIKERKKHVVVMCASTAQRYLEVETNREGIDLIILDELHKISESVHQLVQRSAPYRLGLSATPGERAKFLGRSLVSYGLPQGAKDGFLAPWVISRIPVTGDDWLSSVPDLLKALPHPMGGKVADRLTFTYSGSIKKSKQVQNEREDAVLYNSSTVMRQSILQQARATGANVVEVDAVRTLVEGVNIPELCTVVILSKRKAEDILQILGRVLRKHRDMLNKIGYLIIFQNKVESLPQESVLGIAEQDIPGMSPEFCREALTVNGRQFRVYDGYSTIPKAASRSTPIVDGALRLTGSQQALVVNPPQRENINPQAVNRSTPTVSAALGLTRGQQAPVVNPPREDGSITINGVTLKRKQGGQGMGERKRHK